jgi:hypothetical protein
MQTASGAACLTCGQLFVSVCWCPSLAPGAVTHFVTRLVNLAMATWMQTVGTAQECRSLSRAHRLRVGAYDRGRKGRLLYFVAIRAFDCAWSRLSGIVWRTSIPKEQEMSTQESSRLYRERSRRLDEAIEAARSAARGMSRDEARRRIVAELRAHGIMLPPPSVDLILHDVMLGTGVAGGIRRTAWHLGNAADLAGLAIRFLSAAARRQTLPRWDLGGVHSLRWDPHLRAEVILNPTAQESLAIGAGDETDDGIIEVWLDYPGSGRGLAADARGAGGEPGVAGDEPLVVYYGEERVGVLGAEASDAYRQAVREAYDAGLIPEIRATRSQADDGSWHLRLGMPIPGRMDSGS